jgi:hypothetical protein
VQTNTTEVRQVVAELARLRDAHGRSEVPFDVNVLLLDVVPGPAGVEAFQAMASEIEAAGMQPIFQVVPWYFAGGDPNDLGVRRDAITGFGDEVIRAV